MKLRIALLVVALLSTVVGAEDLAPFAVDPKTAAKPVKLLPASHLKLKLSPIAGGIPGSGPLFTADKEGVTLHAGKFAVGQSFVGFPFGDDQIKPTTNYVSFTASAKSPVQLAVYVAAGQIAETGGSKIVVPLKAGEQSITLPLAAFGLKGTVKRVGFGIDSASTEDIRITAVSVGHAPLTSDYLKSQRTSISLVGTWRFATDDGERGMTEKWFEPTFDDSKWKPLKSNLSWQNQGIAHGGWGWYRQKIVIPAEAKGSPVTISLAELNFDDDVYINGQRIGGLEGNYKYSNLLPRQYSVPADLVKFGEANTIAVRVWGADGGTAGPSAAGLIPGLLPKGPYYLAEADPYAVRLRKPGGEEMPSDRFDLTDAQRGMPFETVFRFPKDVLKSGEATLSYVLADFYGGTITSGSLPITAGADGLPQAVVAIDAETSKTIYLRGRYKAFLSVVDKSGVPIAGEVTSKKSSSAAKEDDTPYGKLKLIDEIDCSVASDADEHPYMHSAFNHAASRNTPGTAIDIKVSEILGKKARESGNGFFAYRIGRGKLKIHGNYLLRVEYPEDKPRSCPMEIQNGHNYMDIGWKNGVSADDPYDNWPLSGKWEWYDAIVSLDEETTGTSGTGGASAENGVWVYFMSKAKPGRYVQQYQGGPAIARIRLYELDYEKAIPVIRKPEGLPQRIMAMDWERQADQPPEDIVRYAKLMGYNAISPIMLKWAFMNYGDPMPGYETTFIDKKRYWVRASAGESIEPAEESTEEETPGEPQAAANGKSKPEPTKWIWPNPPVHTQYLAATKKYDMGYIPRIEYGGSNALPQEAHVINGEGEYAKPTRFSAWGADTLHPATWTDFSRTVDTYFKPYAKDNPQLLGMHWHMRCDRMQMGYSRANIEQFCKETNTPLPEMSAKELAYWASNGPVRDQYGDWWLGKRAEFHKKTVDLLKSYRPDLTLYYYNWDADKFALGVRDMHTAATFVEVAGARFGLVSEVYKRHADITRSFSADDYVNMIRKGNLSDWQGWGREFALRNELYKDMPGIQTFGIMNTVHLANMEKYIQYFTTKEGLAFSYSVSYDENGMRTINPKFEGNMVTPGGGPFSMAYETLAYFYGDARTLTYTVYTYGRGFADAHRRFAQAFLALPAVPGTIIEQPDPDVRIRTYKGDQALYVGVVNKAYTGKKIKVQVEQFGMIIDLVTGKPLPNGTKENGKYTFEIEAGPMSLNSYVIK